jgi:hypothetical protein
MRPFERDHAPRNIRKNTLRSELLSAVSAARDANADNPAEKTGAVAKCPNRAVLSRLHILRGEDRIGWLGLKDSNLRISGTIGASKCAPERDFGQSIRPLPALLGSNRHVRMAPPDRRLHEEGHQAASCEAGRQKEHWRDRASGRIADPRDDVLRDEAAKVAH